MSLEEKVPVQTEKFRLLAGILIAVFILAVGGVGGNWVGSRRQQSLPTDFLSKSKPSWLPTATLVQQLSVSPTVITSHPYPLHSGQLAPNWKIYTNSEYGISFNYPPDASAAVETIYNMLSSQPSRGITIEPTYQAPYQKWYSFDLVVRDNPQNLEAKKIIGTYIEEIRKTCSPPACAEPQMILDTLKQYRNTDVDGYIFHVGAETDSVMVVQVKNGRTYIFSMTGDQGYITSYGLEVFNRILSTFRFSPQ